MDRDASYAIIAAGVLVGGGMISKAALDEFLDPDKPATRAAIQQARRAPVSKFDRTVQFVATSLVVGTTLMRIYDWVTSGKPPDPSELL